MDFKEKWNEFFMDTYGQLPIALVKGEGNYLIDSDGKKYIDFTSGIGVSSLGYGNEQLKKGLKDQIDLLLHTSNIFFNPVAIEAAEKLVNASKLKKVFFANSGAEANEGAIKLARKYSFDKYGEGRGKIISLKQSFHGRTLAALKATGQEKFHNYFFPFPEGFVYVEKNNIEALKEQLDGTVCAVMMEAIQGEGGVFPLDENFVKEAVALCKEKDVLVIFDEVQCGVGRTGKFFGFEHFNVNPDIVTLAKGLGGGLPIGAILAGEKTAGVFKKGDHGSTFGGNPVALKGASVVLDVVTSEGFIDEVAKKGELIKNIIEGFNIPGVKEVRGKGLMLGIELEGESKDVQEKALAKGILTLTAGAKVLRLLPPLTITEEEIKAGLEILKECF
ncbi:acetylornithine aminotransferase [Clostridium folliculivorans]|uniref:Acetylornithine aminotransferase n=2 Tax=Clostridium folliculivorans TaxID=2886038 RepID=A0A9W6DBV7_9CLOT|nr:aspartate aminotransferase family protein [Clostridium folliculivorans]GKU26356.1 acetylornithine aminotransferase [Clostridium folliculivorans]GKU32089.1 acetylornithine aminotransferase [Clostridium folliculivorans]